jgi:NADP-dependent 3-hydroxy acid dehydrogenase YdfG
MENMEQLFESIRRTNVTNAVHTDLYAAISPKRPGLSQEKKTVLITGGGTGVGFAIAGAFVQASASTIIIIGRRQEILEEAASKLEGEAKANGMSTKIITRVADITKQSDIDALWSDFENQNITIDVYVANAAKFSEAKTLFELGTDEVWSQLEANVKSPLDFAEKFYSQKSERQKVGDGTLWTSCSIGSIC